MDRLILITGPSPRGWHRIQTMLECPQKYAYTYLYKMEGADDGEGDRTPLVRGSLLHLGLAHYYKRIQRRQQQEDPDLYYTPAEAIRLYASIMKGLYKDHAEDMVQCLQAYEDHYAMRENYKILHVEELFSAYIGKYYYTGRLDLVVEDSRGQVWALDHKGSGRIEAKHREFYAMSGQLIGYRWLARSAFGTRFAGFKLNLIQHGNNNFQFERPAISPTPYLNSRFTQTILDAEERIEALEASGRAVDEWPLAMNEMTCYGRYGACPHTEKCRWGVKK